MGVISFLGHIKFAQNKNLAYNGELQKIKLIGNLFGQYRGKSFGFILINKIWIDPVETSLINIGESGVNIIRC